MKKKVVFILGPTGSGKTALAVDLAKKFNGEIISADSRQIYIGLDVGTGKDLAEYGDIKYHLIDVAMPEENFTLFDWLDRTREILADILKRGKLPIIAGGTGLYAKALAEGYYIIKKLNIKNQNDKLKLKKITRTELDLMSIEQLQSLASKLKINTANLDIKNPRRLIRAIEKAQEGIETIKNKPDFKSLILAIDLDREELYQRIDKRVDQRFLAEGMLEEVAGLLSTGISQQWLGSLGLEYRIISEYLTGHPELISGSQKTKIPKQVRDDVSTSVRDDKTFQEMIQELKWKTHAYARRQLTWLRKQEDLQWIKNAVEAEDLVAEFIKVL